MSTSSSLSQSSLDFDALGIPLVSKTFFMPDGNVTFLVENTQFRVHRFFFQRDSQFFRDLFARFPSPDDQRSLYGYTIPLNHICALDFEHFLGVLYPTDFGTHSATTVEEWASILSLAAKWGFESIHTLAIKQLTVLASPIDKVVLGRKHNIHMWLLDAYVAICKRPNALTLKEGQRLGLEEVVKIADARQEIRVAAEFVADQDSNNVIEKTFGLDFVLQEVPKTPSLVLHGLCDREYVDVAGRKEADICLAGEEECGKINSAADCGAQVKSDSDRAASFRVEGTIIQQQPVPEVKVKGKKNMKKKIKKIQGGEAALTGNT